MILAIRARDTSPGLVEEVKRQIWSVDSQIPVSDVHAMDELIALSLAQLRFNMLLLGLFAALALVLATAGIYGAMAYAVNQQTHEIGIRTALGAQRRDVLRLVMRDGTKIALFGIASGIAGALALTRLVASLLFEVKPTDPATFAGVAILRTRCARGLLHPGAPRNARGSYGRLEIRVGLRASDRQLSLPKMLSGTNAFEISDIERMNIGAHQPDV